MHGRGVLLIQPPTPGSKWASDNEPLLKVVVAMLRPPTGVPGGVVLRQGQKVRSPMNCFTSVSAFALSKP